MTPLRIEFTIASGSPIREPGHLIHLDALLAWARVEEAKQAVYPEALADYSIQADLPLERLTEGDGAAVWAASALVYRSKLRELRYWSRKTDLYTMAQHRNAGILDLKADKIQTGSGPWKAYSEFETLIHVEKIQAWCIGDKDRVEALLNRVDHIGKRRSKGYGKVRAIQITEDEGAYDWVNYRVITWDKPLYSKMQCGVCPPYWRTAIGYYPSVEVLNSLYAKHIADL